MPVLVVHASEPSCPTTVLHALGGTSKKPWQLLVLSCRALEPTRSPLCSREGRGEGRRAGAAAGPAVCGHMGGPSTACSSVCPCKRATGAPNLAPSIPAPPPPPPPHPCRRHASAPPPPPPSPATSRRARPSPSRSAPPGGRCPATTAPPRDEARSGGGSRRQLLPGMCPDGHPASGKVAEVAEARAPWTAALTLPCLRPANLTLHFRLQRPDSASKIDGDAIDGVVAYTAATLLMLACTGTGREA